MTSMVASAIITKAFQDAQKLSRYAAASADQLADGLDRLNDIINLWQTEGLKLFLSQEVTVTLVEGQQAYTFMPGGDVSMTKPLQVIQATYWDSNGNSRPLDIISWQEWMALTNRTGEGSINQVFIDKQYDRLTMHVWNVPGETEATGTIHLHLRAQATNPANVAASVLFPPEWGIALRWALADELASGMPEAVQMRCSSRAQTFKAALEGWDVEDVETYFQPDQRSQNMGVSRFR